jgi:hypothetical protein
MIEKLQNSLKSLSLVSISFGIYSHIKSKTLKKISNELINERNKFNELNSKYLELLKNKLNENELEKVISNEKINDLIKEMNLLKNKITNQNSITESQLENTNNVLDQLTDVNQSFKNSNNDLNTFINIVEKYINSKNNNNFTNSFTILINDINNFIQGITIEQNLALITISGSIFILLTMFSIISIFYGDYLIIRLNIENKFPKLAKFIQLRRKFRQFYLLTNIIIIILILLIIITFNIHYYFL